MMAERTDKTATSADDEVLLELADDELLRMLDRSAGEGTYLSQSATSEANSTLEIPSPPRKPIPIPYSEPTESYEMAVVGDLAEMISLDAMRGGEEIPDSPQPAAESAVNSIPQPSAVARHVQFLTNTPTSKTGSFLAQLLILILATAAMATLVYLFLW
jgi:hypothetical protein